MIPEGREPTIAPELRQRILDELLRGDAVHPGHAYEVLDSLHDALARYRRHVPFQLLAREEPRASRGRPTDVAERQFEERVVRVLLDYGFQAPDTATAPAVIVLDLMRQAAGSVASDPRNALRRAQRRIRTLARLEALEAARVHQQG